MAYKPYKMKGHSLPGINQNSEGNTDLSDGRSGSSPFQYKYPKSPNKWVQFIPMAISAISAISKAKKSKEEE